MRCLYNIIRSIRVSALLFLVSAGCNNLRNEKPVLQVYDDYLYPSDLEQIISRSGATTPEDSARIAEAYIRQWTINTVMANKAEENLTSDEKDVELLLEDYRNSLLIFRYQQKLVAERVDTNVTEQEMRSYFKAHENDFSLTQPIVRINFVKLRNNIPELAKIQQLMRSNNAADKSKLFQLCASHAEKHFLDEDTWLLLDDVKKEIPIESYNDAHFLRNNRFVQIKEDDMLYLLRIFDYRVQNGPSEYSFEKEKIKALIIQQRKNDFLKQLEADLLTNAEAEGKLNQ